MGKGERGIWMFRSVSEFDDFFVSYVGTVH